MAPLRNSHTPDLIGLRNKIKSHPSPERFRLSSSALQLMVEKKADIIVLHTLLFEKRSDELSIY